MTWLWWLLWAAGAVVVVWLVCRAFTRATAVCESAIHDAGPDNYDTTAGGHQ